jgi:hypothetical protein
LDAHERSAEGSGVDLDVGARLGECGGGAERERTEGAGARSLRAGCLPVPLRRMYTKAGGKSKEKGGNMEGKWVFSALWRAWHAM